MRPPPPVGACRSRAGRDRREHLVGTAPRACGDGDAAAAPGRGAERTCSPDRPEQVPGPAAGAIREWCGERVDETVLISPLPAGPDEPSVSEPDIAAVRAVLGRLAEQAGVKAATTGRRARAKAS